MSHSVNVYSIKCATPSPGCKYSCANAHSGHFFATRNPSTNHNAGAEFLANGQCTNVIPGATLCRQWQVRRCSIRACLILVHIWPSSLANVYANVYAARYSSPARKPNMNSLLCDVRNWRLES